MKGMMKNMKKVANHADSLIFQTEAKNSASFPNEMKMKPSWQAKEAGTSTEIKSSMDHSTLYGTSTQMYSGNRNRGGSRMLIRSPAVAQTTDDKVENADFEVIDMIRNLRQKKL
jgi:hypothetical protein